ncbi:MAG: hypothetical protein LBG61_04070 [Burkholderiales bacterium]|nr:hypothetical protein [Burkholderiales bacterium]
MSALSVALLWLFRNKLPHDTPNHRTLHQEPIPSVGGLSVWSGLLFGVAAILAVYGRESELFRYHWAALLVGVLLLVAVSLRDDFKHVSPLYRLVFQCVAAILVTACWSVTETSLQPSMFDVYGLFSAPRFTVLCAIVFFVMWMANLFNFMDGADGLAATMVTIGFSTLAIAARHMGLSWWWLPALTVVAILPFALLNLPPAKMFLGDVGAIPTGFLAAGLGGLGIVEDAWSLWFVILTFLPFIMDASVTLARRLLKCERVWEAHNNHYFQRLIRLGLGHRGVLLMFATLMVGCAGSALFCLYSGLSLFLALLLWTLIHAAFFVAVDVAWHRRKGV